jgi:F-type H+-transporting ATPase subunit c
LDSPTSNASDSAGNTAFQTVKRQQASKILSATTRQAFQTRRAYSSEIAQAMVEVSKNIGMGTAAVGLTGAGIGIGLVFASLLSSVARNPALRGQLFTYAILGFAFVEAIGLFDLMVALMAKFVSAVEIEIAQIGDSELTISDRLKRLSKLAEAGFTLRYGMCEGAILHIGEPMPGYGMEHHVCKTSIE